MPGLKYTLDKSGNKVALKNSGKTKPKKKATPKKKAKK